MLNLNQIQNLKPQLNLLIMITFRGFAANIFASANSHTFPIAHLFKKLFDVY